MNRLYWLEQYIVSTKFNLQCLASFREWAPRRHSFALSRRECVDWPVWRRECVDWPVAMSSLSVSCLLLLAPGIGTVGLPVSTLGVVLAARSCSELELPDSDPVNKSWLLVHHLSIHLHCITSLKNGSWIQAWSFLIALCWIETLFVVMLNILKKITLILN